MSIKVKILFILLSVSFILFLYLLISSRPMGIKLADREQASVDMLEETNANLVKKDKNELEQSYKQGIKPIFSQCERLLEPEEVSTEQIAIIKNSVLDLIVPTGYRDLHLDLFFAITKIEIFLEEGVDEEKVAYQQIINQLKEKYAWLN